MLSLRDGATHIGSCGVFLRTRLERRLFLLSLVVSQWGHSTDRVWFFSHSIATKSSFVIWSIFLQDGVTLFRSGSNDMISSEGIPTVGLLGAFFRPVLGVSFCHPLVGRLALRRGGFHIQLSSLLATTLCVSL